jgi:hypothetical protein
MKICKAIKVCRKLAKAALPDSSPDRHGTLRAAKSLLERFNDELAARSESTSIRQAAAAIAAAGRIRRAAGSELDRLAELAAGHLSTRPLEVRKDEESAVAIVRMLAWNIRAVAMGPRAASRKADPAQSLRLA